MITLRQARERGHTDLGWLDSDHTFSSGDYHDPKHMGFRDLRVINEDWVHPGKGFGRHPHRDMEIITVVLDGSLEHSDSLGNGSVIRPGEVQVMSAGTGVTHSEFNPSQTEAVHLLQIWILPQREGISPRYDQRAFPREEREGKLHLEVSGSGREGSLKINQDAELFFSTLASGKEVDPRLRPGRHAWLQVARGVVSLNTIALEEGDGAAVSGETALSIRASQPSEILLFDLP